MQCCDAIEDAQRGLIGDFQFVGDVDTALVSVSYQSYLADYGRAALISHELEVGPIVAPPGVELPTVADFLSGADQRSSVGVWPAAVYCDCAPAIAAGRAIYGEPKFESEFTIDVPAPNAPGSRWSVAARADDRTCELTLTLDGTPIEHVGQPIVNYGRRETGEVVSSRWDIFVGSHWWSDASVDVADWAETLTGGSNQRHRELVEARCVQVREHRSPVVAQRSRPFYPTAA